MQGKIYRVLFQPILIQTINKRFTLLRIFKGITLSIQEKGDGGIIY